MKRLTIFLLVLIACGSAFGNAWNTWQTFPPTRNNVTSVSLVTAPVAPSNLTATDGDGVIDLAWTDNSTNETGFEIQVDIDGGGYSTIHTTAANTTTYQYGSATLGSDYTFKCRAINSGGNSSYATSNTVTHDVVAPVFRASFDSTITPEIGTAGTYTRAGTAYYNATASTVSSKSANTAAVPAYVSGFSGGHGYQSMNDVKNWILRSEEFDNASWTAVAGGGTSANTATAPDGASTADTISGSTSGDGIEQDSGKALSNTDAYTFSVWLKATSGSPSVDLVLKDGGSQSTTSTVVIGPTWKRYAVYRKFTAGPTGNAIVQILVGNTSTVRAWGAHLDESQASPYTFANEQTIAGNTTFGGYVPTTSAVATQTQDELKYCGSEITTQRTKHSLLAWVYRPTFTDIWQPNYLVMLSSNTHGVQQGMQLSNSSYNFDVYYGGNSGAVNSTSAGIADAFNQIIVVSDLDADSYQTYVNGALVQTNTTARAPLTSNECLNIGHQYAGDNGRFQARTIIGKTEYYAYAIDATEAAYLFNAQKNSYRYSETNSDPNVKALFYLDEGSGDIVDEVSGITLTQRATHGAPTYSVAAPGFFYGWTPGITYATNKEHQKLSATTALNIGASDHFVVEWAQSNTSGLGGEALRYSWTYNVTNSTDYGNIVYSTSTTNMTLILKADDGTSITKSFTTPDWNDGVVHKFRLVVDRSGNVELFMDGVSCGTNSMATLASKVWTNQGLRIPGQFNNGGLNWPGTVYVWRMSIGTDVLSNNLGGTNGG